MTKLDIPLIQAKIYAAIVEVSGAQQQPFSLRPSNIGSCPVRLQKQQRDAGRGIQEQRTPKQAWPPFQGQVAEELMVEILRVAGADVISPPADSSKWEESVEADPQTGFKPHLDGLILWPEVGVEDWAVLELKDMRAFAQIDFFRGGLYNERGYWYQGVSYLMLAHKAIENYAAFEAAAGEPLGLWTHCRNQRLIPSGLFFMSLAKDPATARMHMSAMTNAPKYEDAPPKANKAGVVTPTQVKIWQENQLKTALRKILRARMEDFDNNTDFYLEYIPRDDESVIDAWHQIVAVKQQLDAELPVEPLYDISVPDEELSTECRWYCAYLEEHRADLGMSLPGENQKIEENIQEDES